MSIVLDEKSWAIGIFEGEGWAGSPKDRIGTPQIRVGMIDKDVIERFKRIMECGEIYISKTSTGKPMYVWLISSNKALEILKEWFDHLSKRRQEQALKVLNKFPNGCAKVGGPEGSRAKKYYINEPPSWG